MPLVSVIMNCYNSSAYLDAAFASLKAQTFTDFEVVFWDNASTDASPAKAQAYGEGMRYCRAEYTTPLGEARNLAIAQAQGSLLAFLDCDDEWLPEKLALQVGLFEANPKVGLVCTDTEMFCNDKVLSRVFAGTPPRRGLVFRELVRSQWISMSSAIIRKSALDSLDAWFDPSMSMCEEADVFYRLAKDWELDFVDRPLTRWRVHSVSTSFRKFGFFAVETRQILAKHRRLYADYDERYPDLVALLERRAAFQEAVSLWREGQGERARRCIRPYLDSTKHRLFWLASWFPGSFFDALSQLYFSLPLWIRR